MFFSQCGFLDLWGIFSFNECDEEGLKGKLNNIFTIFFHRPISGSFHVSLIILLWAVVALKQKNWELRTLIDDTNENVSQSFKQLKFVNTSPRRHWLQLSLALTQAFIINNINNNVKLMSSCIRSFHVCVLN